MWWIVAAVAVAWGLYNFFTRRRERTIVANPRLGVLNRQGAAADGIAASDARQVDASAMFVPAANGPDGVPICDVLLLYCDLPCDLSAILSQSGARVVVVASENPPEPCAAAAQVGISSGVNLVVTIDRKGDTFGLFLARLFSEMASGTPMPLAWVKLAPQNPARNDPNVPVTLFACGAGPIAFA